MQRNFAFQSFKNYDTSLRNTLVQEAKGKQFAGEYQLIGRDRDSTVLGYAKENAERAGVADCITREQSDFSESSIVFPNDFRQLTNPPYGKRLSSDEELAPLYQRLAQYLRDCFGGVISSYPMQHLFPAKSFSHKSLYNGADKVDFYRKKPV